VHLGALLRLDQQEARPFDVGRLGEAREQARVAVLEALPVDLRADRALGAHPVARNHLDRLHAAVGVQIPPHTALDLLERGLRLERLRGVPDPEPEQQRQP
jgi:hypothetical protein